MRTNETFIIDADCLFRGSLRARKQLHGAVIFHLYSLIKLRQLFCMSPQQLPIIIYNNRPCDDNQRLKERILKALVKVSVEESLPWLLQQDLHFLQGRPDNFSWLSLTELAPDIIPEKVRVFAKNPVFFQSCRLQHLQVTQAEKYGICKHVLSSKPVQSKKRVTVLVDLDDTALLRAPSLRFNTCTINMHLLSLCHYFQNQFEQCDFIVLTARSCVRSAVIKHYHSLLGKIGLPKNSSMASQNDSDDLKKFIELMQQLMRSPLQTNGTHPALIALNGFFNVQNSQNLIYKLAQLLANKSPKADWRSVVSVMKRLHKSVQHIERPTSTHRIVHEMNQQGIPLEVRPWSFANTSTSVQSADKIDRIKSNVTNTDQAVIFIDDYLTEIAIAVNSGESNFTQGLHIFMCHSNLPMTHDEMLSQRAWIARRSGLTQTEQETIVSQLNDGAPVEVSSLDL